MVEHDALDHLHSLDVEVVTQAHVACLLHLRAFALCRRAELAPCLQSMRRVIVNLQFQDRAESKGDFMWGQLLNLLLRFFLATALSLGAALAMAFLTNNA